VSRQKKVNQMVNSILPSFLDIPVRCTSNSQPSINSINITPRCGLPCGFMMQHITGAEHRNNDSENG